MNLIEFFKRLKIGFAMIVGFFLGKWAATTYGDYSSVFFVGGFGLGVIVTQGAFWVLERLRRADPAQSKR